MTSQTIVARANCPNCGTDQAVLMKRLDTKAIFAECRRCESGYRSPDLTDRFSTHDLYWERSNATIQEARTAGWSSLRVLGAMPEFDSAPEPVLVAAWFALDRLALERIPWWAAEWLAQGHDGASLRELAGEDGNDFYRIADLFPLVLAEMQIVIPTSTREAATTALDHVAQLCLDGFITEREATRLVSHLLAAADFAMEFYELPLGTLFGLEDEWDSGWGRPMEELKGEVQRACVAHLARRT